MIVRYLTESLPTMHRNSGVRTQMTLPKGIWLALTVVLLLPGCVFTSHRDAGTVMGGGIGALTGAMIGGQSGHGLGGALIGSVAGGLVGNLVGNAEDMRQQRDAAIMQAQYLASTGQILTNTDVIRLVQNGISDDVIIGVIRSSPGKYDLHPDAILQMKAFGTSDKVIIALQQITPVRTVSPVGFVPSSPAGGVIVAPAPVVMFGAPRFRYCDGPYHYGRRW